MAWQGKVRYGKVRQGEGFMATKGHIMTRIRAFFRWFSGNGKQINGSLRDQRDKNLARTGMTRPWL